MWSGPRNMSTTMMRSFGARSDTACVDEPFYASWLIASGETHPMQNEILAAQSHAAVKVEAELSACLPRNKSVFFQKHMTHHMDLSRSMDWASTFSHAFLIRHPARVIPSYQRKMETLSLKAIGFPQQVHIFDQVRHLTGRTPPVVDSDQILANPEAVLKRLCTALELDWDAAMLSWSEGPHTDDGVWAPHWYDAVWTSTGFGPAPGPLPQLAGEAAAIEKEALEIYERLLEFHV
ncbi:UNVERIFIED_CONTAM: hypothetical protein GTU68_027000 [Idotea baltica]|nr:hypothetical protein [Idotea baltica]